MAPAILIAITSVFLHGRIIEPGKEFACDLSHAKKLVEGDSARLKGGKAPENTGENGENQGKNAENTPDNSADLQEKLDGLTVAKLKELAQKHEIQLKSDDNKAEIIEKIITTGIELDETDI